MKSKAPRATAKSISVQQVRLVCGWNVFVVNYNRFIQAVITFAVGIDRGQIITGVFIRQFFVQR